MTDPVRDSTGTYYRVRVADPVGGISPRQIDFLPVPHAVIPGDVAELQLDIDRAVAVLVALFPKKPPGRDGADPNEAKFREYFDKTAGLAIAGIGQNQMVLGRLALEALKAEIVAREGGRIKNAYVAWLGGWAVGFLLLFMGCYLLVRFQAIPPLIIDPAFSDWIGLKKNFFVLFAGSAIGTWLSFSLRKTELTFFELGVIESDLLNPPLRLCFVVGLSLVVGLFFLTGFIHITIGGFNTDIVKSGSYALLIGLFCGIGEQGLSTTVSLKTNEFFSALAQRGAVMGPPPPAAGGGGAGGEVGGAPPKDSPDKTKPVAAADASPQQQPATDTQKAKPEGDQAANHESLIFPDDYDEKAECQARAAP